MKEFKPNTTEKPFFVILGIVIFFLLVDVFLVYLYFMHKMSFHTFITLSAVLIVLYFPRFYIIKKIIKADVIKADENYLIINDCPIELSEIVDYKIERKKTQVIFFINNQMVVFNEAICYLRLKGYQMQFVIIGKEKIELIENFLSKVVEMNKS